MNSNLRKQLASTSFSISISLLLCLGITDAQEKKPKESKWEKAISAFEKIDQKSKPDKGSVLFLGSSSIRMWKLKKWFPKKNYLNRGFGGSQISDSIEFFDRVVVPYKPKTIVFYAGDNDIAKGKTPQKVFMDFQTFHTKVQSKSPKTKIVFVAIKPSLARWNLIDPMRKANKLISDFADSHKSVIFADIDTPMLGEDGKPKPELFLKDGLHLNESGYKVWYDVVAPLIK